MSTPMPSCIAQILCGYRSKGSSHQISSQQVQRAERKNHDTALTHIPQTETLIYLRDKSRIKIVQLCTSFLQGGGCQGRGRVVRFHSM